MNTNLPEPSFASGSNLTRNEATLTHQPGTNGSVRRLAAEGLEQLVALKKRIVANLEQEFAGTIGSRLIRQIVTEAEALAATTPFPALLLPGLAEEKARHASRWAVCEQTIPKQGLTLAA